MTEKQDHKKDIEDEMDSLFVGISSYRYKRGLERAFTWSVSMLCLAGIGTVWAVTHPKETSVALEWVDQKTDGFFAKAAKTIQGSFEEEKRLNESLRKDSLRHE